MTRIALLAIVVSSAIAANSSAAKSDSPLPCLFRGETYTEGAYLYPNRLLLLTCTIDGGRPLWKVVPTSRLNDLRLNGSNPDSIVTRESSTKTAGPPGNMGDQKCLVVNGKQYCQ